MKRVTTSLVKSIKGKQQPKKRKSTTTTTTTTAWLFALAIGCAVLFFWQRQSATLRHLDVIHAVDQLPSHNGNHDAVVLPSLLTVQQEQRHEPEEQPAVSAPSPPPKSKLAKHDKPIFYFYVGLPKTATTFLQCTLCVNQTAVQPILAQDDFVYVGTCPYRTCGLDDMPRGTLMHRFNAFFTKTKEAQEGMGPKRHANNSITTVPNNKLVPKISPLLQHALRKAQGKHALLIYEGANVFPAAFIQKIAQRLHQQWRVRILVGYRPLYAWLPSKYNSVHKHNITNLWPGVKVNKMTKHTGVPVQRVGTAVLPFDLHGRGAFSEMVDDIAVRHYQHPAETVRDNYARHFRHVKVLPLHQVKSAVVTNNSSAADPLLDYLFCHVIRNAPYTCRHVQQGGWKSTAGSGTNPSVNLDPDILAVAAHEAGLVPTNMTRRVVGKAIAQHLEQLQQHDTSYTSWPMTCRNETKLQEFEHLSWNLEEQLFSGNDKSNTTADTLKQQHARGFARAHDKFCHVDTKATLQQATWLAFFANLTTSFVDSES